ncbi:tobamovirus multiplication protein 2A isoform X2 [Vigna angularis]|uniref:tobamovirus multiplication protein 2A isoform X2 n=1 Tax=Phaseolus angularis TaxID=3914 RepID=UPI0008099E8C|nr:tobamovirus multiplication protein 2A isoform X2 [Vigna angularis]
MACRGCWECLLKLLNFILCVTGLAIVGYGIYLFVEFSKASDDNTPDISPVSDDSALIQLGRPMLMVVSLSDSFLDNLPRAWFIYLFIGTGVVLFLISCFGCIGAATRNGCCLSCYSILVVLLILIELGWAGFIFFDKNWKEALLFLLALIVRAANRPAEYDSDEEFINSRQQVRQPLLNRSAAGPATGLPASGTVDQRSSRNDAWSARMREKYGLDTSEFTYNPSESSRFQQVNSQTAEEKSRCTIM